MPLGQRRIYEFIYLFFLSFPGGNATLVFQPGSATEGVKYIRNFIFYRVVIPGFYFLVFFYRNLFLKECCIGAAS